MVGGGGCSNSVKWYERIFYFIFCSLLKRVLTLVQASCRIQHIEGKEHLDRLLREGRPVILCFWHNNIFYGAPFLYRSVHKKGVSLRVLISRSKDAELIARVVTMWGGTAVRGSSSRYGGEGVLSLYRNAGKAYSATVITPDGPRGPKYKFQMGAITLSQMTGVPIIPVNFNVRNKWVLRSWDAFIIPKPFSKVVVQLGSLYKVPKTISEQKKEKIRKEIEDIMVKQVERGEEMIKNL